MMADLTEEGPIHRFELYHTVDGSAERLERIAIKEGSEAGDVAQVLFDFAEHDASTRDSGHQRYTVAAFRSESQSEPETQFPFRINGRPKNAWTGGDTEQPTDKGERAQMMRMQNDSHALVMRMADSIGGRLSAEIDKIRKDRDALEEKIRKMSNDAEDLADRRLDRELVRAEVLQRTKLYGDVASSLLPLLAPIAGGLVNRFMMSKGEKNGHSAKSLVPKNPEVTERKTLVKEFVECITAAEGAAIAEALNPIKLVTLNQIAGLKDDDDPLMTTAFDTAMWKFMKALETPEVMAIMAALETANRNRFMTIYQAYGKLEMASQEGLADVLKDQPPPPERSASSDQQSVEAGETEIIAAPTKTRPSGARNRKGKAPS